MIGILTFFQCYNYGAYLQAYALHKYLIQKGYDNEFINYRSKLSEKNEYHHLVNVDGKKSGAYFRILLKMLWFKIYHRKLKKTKRLYRSEDLNTIQYQTVLVGSDQVWCYTREWGGFDPVYFSYGINARKIIAYAASMGPDNYDQEHPEVINSLMKNFDSLGVRDTNTYQFARLFSGKDPQIVLDPVCLYDFEKECKETTLEPYILFYSDALTPSDAVIEELQRTAKERGLMLVSLGKKFSWCGTNILSASPFEWLGYIKNAQFVITCMYHGLLFSIKYGKNFAVFLNEHRKNKCLDFLKNAELTDRVIDRETKFEAVFASPIDYTRVQQFLDEKRKASEVFLDNCLKDHG